jgi:hypothetical protein
MFAFTPVGTPEKLMSNSTELNKEDGQSKTGAKIRHDPPSRLKLDFVAAAPVIFKRDKVLVQHFLQPPP